MDISAGRLVIQTTQPGSISAALHGALLDLFIHCRAHRIYGLAAFLCRGLRHGVILTAYTISFVTVLVIGFYGGQIVFTAKSCCFTEGASDR